MKIYIFVFDNKGNCVMVDDHTRMIGVFETLAEAMHWELTIQTAHPDYHFTVKSTL
jgi:hypothetical protein